MRDGSSCVRAVVPILGISLEFPASHKFEQQYQEEKDILNDRKFSHLIVFSRRTFR